MAYKWGWSYIILFIDGGGSHVWFPGTSWVLTCQSRNTSTRRPLRGFSVDEGDGGIPEGSGGVDIFFLTSEIYMFDIKWAISIACFLVLGGGTPQYFESWLTPMCFSWLATATPPATTTTTTTTGSTMWSSTSVRRRACLCFWVVCGLHICTLVIRDHRWMLVSPVTRDNVGRVGSQ